MMGSHGRPVRLGGIAQEGGAGRHAEGRVRSGLLLSFVWALAQLHEG